MIAAARRAVPEPLYQWLRRRRLARKVARYQPWERVGHYGGHPLTIRITDPLSEGWYDHDWPRLPEIEMLRDLGRLKRGASVFDVGAHQGVVALMLAREVGEEGHVLAVEAERHNAEVAYRNVAVNNATHVEVLHAAVGERNGTVAFHESLNGSVAQEGQHGDPTVAMCTIDSLASDRQFPDVVFLDIEGYEGQALQAAEQVIDSGASFFVEVHVESLVGCTPEWVVEQFEGRELYIAAHPGDHSYAFEPYAGELPKHRFYLLAP